MRFEVLIQFIVPLTFLAIWALTSILNRDAQPLPPRPGGRPGGPRGPGPGNPAGPGGGFPRGVPRPQEVGQRPGGGGISAPPREPAMGEGLPRWGETAAAPQVRERSSPRFPSDLDDAIVYLEPGPAARGRFEPPPRPTAGGASPAGSGRSPRVSSRRAPRVRAAASSPPAADRSQEETHRALTDMVSQSLAKQRAKPLEIAPLASPSAQWARPLTEISAASVINDQATRGNQPSMSSTDVRQLIANPARLREVVILGEILQPPRSIRGRRPRPMR